MKAKAKIYKIYYCWHPDFVQHEDGTYHTLKTGRYVVEWDVKFIGNNLCCHHHTAECKTKTLAEKLCNILSRKHEELSAYLLLDDDDISFQNGVFVCENGIYKIIGKSGASKITYQLPA